MLNLRSVLKEPIPAIDPVFLKRLWIHQSQRGSSSGIGYTLPAITGICGSSSTDPVAIWARTALIGIALKAGKMDKLVQNGSLPQAVFDAAATFPLPDGLEGFNCDVFVARLTQVQPGESMS